METTSVYYRSTGGQRPMTTPSLRIMVLLVLVPFMMQGEALASDFLGELKMRRASTREAQVEVSDIVMKYIAAGSNVESVKEFLERNQFPVEIKLIDGCVVRLVASRHERGIFSLFGFTPLALMGFYNEVRIIVDVQENNVTRAQGFIFYHSL